MTAVTRLVTLADLADEVAGGRSVSFSARHEAVLSDGSRPLLLDDRGWTQAAHGAVPQGAALSTLSSPEDIEATARMVVGPDEPADGDSHDDARLPHDVVLSHRLRTRL